MAEMYANLSAVRTYTYCVGRAADNGYFSNKDCAGVILFGAEKCTQVCLDAIQVLGGNGYINDYPTGRFLRDAKLYEIGAGTQEVQYDSKITCNTFSYLKFHVLNGNYF